jgi:tetratricopeptide (TPR) repeat protein
MLVSSCSTGSKLSRNNKSLKDCSQEQNLGLRAECLTKAIEKDPGNPSLYFLRGKTYQGLFKFTKAMADFLKVVELEPGNREACYAIASVAAISYHKEYALYWLEKAIDAGYNDYQKIINDPSLENLRENEKFKTLLKEKCVNTVSYK